MEVKPSKTIAESIELTITFDQDIEAETVTLTSTLTTSSVSKSGKVLTFTVDAAQGYDRTEYNFKGKVNDEVQYTYLVVLEEELENISYYGTVHEADVFYNTLTATRSAVWTASTAVVKRRAIIEATRAIDRLAFKGAKSSSTQPLEFPRASGTTPVQIEEAAYLLAIKYVPAHDADDDYSRVGVNAEKYHDVSRDYFENSRNITHIASGIPSIEAWRLLMPFLRSPRTIKSIRI